MKAEEKRTPVVCPTTAEISGARQILSDWHLHVYQLLYFHEPQWTTVQGAAPFKVEWDDAPLSSCAPHSIRIICINHPKYTFKASMNDAGDDESLLRRCQLVLDAVAAGKTAVNRLACCGLSVRQNCVCEYSQRCELHGAKCIGSHD